MARSPRPWALASPASAEPEASARARDIHLLVAIDRVRNGLRSSREQGQELTNARGSRASQQRVGDRAQLQTQKAREQLDAARRAQSEMLGEDRTGREHVTKQQRTSCLTRPDPEVQQRDLVR